MADEVTAEDPARPLGVRHGRVRSRLPDLFDQQSASVVVEELSRRVSEAFVAWHATRFGITG